MTDKTDKFNAEDQSPESVLQWKAFSTETQRQLIDRMCVTQKEPTLIEFWLQVAFKHPVRAQKAKELLPPVIVRALESRLREYSKPTMGFWGFVLKMNNDTNIALPGKLFDEHFFKKLLDNNAQGRKLLIDLLSHANTPARLHTTVCQQYFSDPNEQNKALMQHVDLQKVITKDSRQICFIVNHGLRSLSKPTKSVIAEVMNNAQGLKLAQRMVNTFSTECFQSYKHFFHQAIQWWPHELVCETRKPYLLKLFEQHGMVGWNDKISSATHNDIAQYLQSHETAHLIKKAVDLKAIEDTPKKRSKM